MPRSTGLRYTCCKQSGHPYVSEDFFPYGYDERQYCSPGFNLPVGCLMRTPHGSFPEYHTSADNLDFVRPENLATSLDAYRQVIEVLEGNGSYLNLNPKCEPQLGRRGLYGAVGADLEPETGSDGVAVGPESFRWRAQPAGCQ